MDDAGEVPIGLLVRLLDLRVTRLAADRLAPIEVTPAEMSVLGTIAGQPGLRASALAAKLMIKPPNLTKIINRLEGQGLVRRSVAREDERAVALGLTAKGRRAVAFGQQASREIEAVLLAALPPESREDFLPMLRLLLRAAERMPEGTFADAAS